MCSKKVNMKESYKLCIKEEMQLFTSGMVLCHTVNLLCFDLLHGQQLLFAMPLHYVWFLEKFRERKKGGKIKKQ